MNPLAALPHTAVEHFRVHFFGAVLALRERAGAERFPFLADYAAEPDAAGLGTARAWEAATADWERGADLPLTRLARATGTSPRPLLLAGLVEEDARFGAVFEAFTGHSRPTPGLLHAWWPQQRAGLRLLAELGLVEALDPAAARGDAVLRVAPAIWDALRGDPPAVAEGLRHRPVASLPDARELLLPAELRTALARAPAVLAGGTAGAVIVRGAAANGRRTLLAALARSLGRGVLEVDAPEPHWRRLGALATLLDALPVAVLDVPAGEGVRLEALRAYSGPLGVVLGRRGGVTGPAVERAVTLELGLPSPELRARHWAAALGPEAPVAALATRLRMTGGNIRRTASLAAAEAALDGRHVPDDAAVRRAARALQGRLLDGLATRVETTLGWDQLIVRPETQRELELLETRCRCRERLAGALGLVAAAGLGVGVRALLSGPSGTGKTLAARALAGALGIDLYRVELSAVVNKYLGETEKNLETLFSRAEEADAALLLDEGDALLTRRTDVHTANDRYANLETNFLLQRLESFDGILLITTNAANRIDGAFRRRMDVVIDLAPPDEAERWAIWRVHLPAAHAVPESVLEEVAVRCVLAGGQIRNAVLHASLLALEAGGELDAVHLRAAVRREYTAAGTVCPLVTEPALA